MHKILFILGGSIALLLLFLGLIRVKNMEEGYEGSSGHGGGHGGHGGSSGHGEGHGGHHGSGGHGGDRHPEYHGSGGWYNGYYPVYAQYEYPIYYVNDQDDYIFDENGILYYIYNPHLFWRRIWG
jgi:hypothetical protein